MLHTCDGALAGVAAGRGTDSVRRGRDVVAAVLDHNGVTSRAVGDVRHPVRAVAVVVDTGLFGLPVLVLAEERPESFRTRNMRRPSGVVANLLAVQVH